MQRLGIDRSGERTLVNIRCFSGEKCPAEQKLAEDVETNVRRVVDLLYQGKQPDFDLNPQEGSSFQVPVCDRQGGFFAAEREQNHSGKSCGASACAFDMARVCTVCGRKDCGFRPVWSGVVAVVQEKCEKERAWKRGALIHQVHLALEELKAEMQTGTIRVGQRCMSATVGGELGNLSSGHDQLLANWGEINGGRVFACDLIDEQNPDRSIEVEENFGYFVNDRRVPRQAACALNAALHGIFGSWSHLAFCETFGRAEERFVEIAEKLDAAVQRVANKAATDCFAAGRKLTKKNERTGKIDEVPHPDCITQLYRSAFEAEFDQVLKGDAQGARSSGKPGKKLVEAEGALASCPAEAPDCKACRDPVFCGTGSALSAAELAAVAGGVADLVSIRKNLGIAASLLSDRPAVDLDWLGPLLNRNPPSCSKWVVPGAFNARSPAAAPSPAPSASPGPLAIASPEPAGPRSRPSPEPSRSPSPSPNAGATPNPWLTDTGVTIWVFPKRTTE